MNKIVYITTPLYYVNAEPHIGHAYTNILCDTFARFHRFMGRDVFFMTGTDEHGTKIDRTARDQGKEPKHYVDQMVPKFKKLWEVLGIEFDYFIRTTDEDHKEIVGNILKELEAKGDIYRGVYKGWYCTPCESFWTELQLREGKCPDCGRAVQRLEEDGYFFKLSKYREWLIDYVKGHPSFVWPKTRRNEILGFLEQPLEDLCISRPRSRLAWGIAFPNDPEHVVYVWFDALINYLSGAGYSRDKKRLHKLWPADMHVVGKDILRQHAVYWPIMLKAIGVEMPKTVLAHGWWTVAGSKVSKSVGNIVDPLELIGRFGVDTLRYYLLHEVTLGLDGSYSEDLINERFNSDLANDLGNLVFRSTSMLERYFEGKVPAVEKPIERTVSRKVLDCKAKLEDAMNEFRPNVALDAVWDVIREANRFVERHKPWTLAKEENKDALAGVLIELLESVRGIGILLVPFLPFSSKAILECYGVTARPMASDLKSGALKPGMPIRKGKPLFPKEAQE